MLTSDLNDLMKLYSMRGVDDWKKNTRAKLRIAVRDRLSNSGIADDERDIRRMICRIFHDGDSRKQFIPMPKCSGSNIDWCFFLPVKIAQENNEYLRLFLLIKCKGYNWIGFRFEGDSKSSRHGYSHLQFTRNIPEFPDTFGPDWLPDSDPAFPIPARDSLEMFLCMATAVHGLRGGMDDLLVDIFQKASRPGYALQYKKRLYKMLNTNP